MVEIQEKWKNWNVIPAHPTEKKPNVGNWKYLMEEMYPIEKLIKHEGSVGVITGKISNNLWSPDLDFKKNHKDQFPRIWDEFQNQYPDLAQTYIEASPNGYHPFYYVIGIVPDNTDTKNAGYYRKKKGKNKGNLYFHPTTVTKYSLYLKGFDTRGEGGFMVIAPSKYESGKYKPYNDLPIKTITEEECESIQKFFLLEKSKSVRKPFVNLLNGIKTFEEQIAIANENFNPDDYPLTKDGEKEKAPTKTGLIKMLFIEGLYNGIQPEELYDGLTELQKGFDLEKTKNQYRTIIKAVKEGIKPMTSKSMKKYFPNYKYRPVQTNIKPSKRVIPKLTPEQIEKVEKFLQLPKETQRELITDIINFQVKGERAQNQAILLLFLMMGNIIAKRLMNQIHLHGDASAGKSWEVEKVVEMLPDENVMVVNSATGKSFFYSSDFDEHIKLIFLKEIHKNDQEIIGVVKAFHDGDVAHLTTVYKELDARLLQKYRTGFVMTYSFDFTQTDAEHRAWVLAPD